MQRPNARRRAIDLAFEEDVDDEFVVRRPRWIRERIDHFTDLDDIDFITRFRLSKRSVLTVLESIENQLEFTSDRNNSISPINQLLCGLRFYATGCFQAVAADFGGFSTSTANRIVHRVSRAIASMRPQTIFFPDTREQIRHTQIQFYKIARFPRVIGAVDCTHVKLVKSPDTENGEIFRNRKNFFSLNVQVICNSALEMTDIVCRWPGSTHDSHIFNNCRRKVLFETGRYGDSLLVGDSGYACNKYLLTPLDYCETPAQHLYNESQIRTRKPVERMFGVWKRRFPVLAIGLRVNLEKAFPVIISTAVLHNIALRARETLPPDDLELNLPAPWERLIAEGDVQPNPANRNLIRPAGRPAIRENVNFRERRILVTTHFQRLSRMGARMLLNEIAERRDDSD